MSGPFAQITQGPANTSGKNTNQQALVFDRQNNVVSSVGDAGTEQAHQTSMAVLNAQTALTAITTAQNLLSVTLNKGFLNRLARTLLVSGSIIYTSPGTTTPTISIAVKLGSVTLCTITTAAISSTASTNMPIQFAFQLDVAAIGASGTIEAHGQVSANLSANTAAAAITTFLDTNTAPSSAVDLTTSLALAVTIASSGAGITGAQLRQATLELVA
jgi:hypothetical protein